MGYLGFLKLSESRPLLPLADDGAGVWAEGDLKRLGPLRFAVWESES